MDNKRGIQRNFLIGFGIAILVLIIFLMFYFYGYEWAKNTLSFFRKLIRFGR